MRPIFRDSRLQALFTHQGYVQVDLLTAADVATLTDLYDSNAAHMPQSPASFTVAMNDMGLRRRISSGIRAVFEPRIAGVLDRCRTIIGNFFHKQPDSPKSQFRMHQDWYFVDETQHHSLSVWCPMDDVDEVNGTLSVIPGSHRLSQHVRGYGTGFPFIDLESIVREKYSRLLPMKAGAAVFFDQRLYHWSGPNGSQTRRLATNCFVAPEEAQLVFPHTDPQAHPDRIELFAADEDLYTSFVLGVRPQHAKSLGLVDAQIPSLSAADLERVLGPHLMRAGAPVDA